MPTKKPIIQTVLTETVYKKFQTIAEREQRTLSNLGQVALTEYVKAYEAEHGEIQTDYTEN